MTNREFLEGLARSWYADEAKADRNRGMQARERYILDRCADIDRTANADASRPPWWRPFARWRHDRAERAAMVEVGRLTGIEHCPACTSTFAEFDLPCAIHQRPAERELSLGIAFAHRVHHEGRRR